MGGWTKGYLDALLLYLVFSILTGRYVLSVSDANAATLNVVGGQLLGASGVIVDGSSYNVEFLDGTCIDLYSGCDEGSDFVFLSWAAAELASQALLDQMFLDGANLFDSNPALTAGCPNVGGCQVNTTYDLDANDNAPISMASHTASELSDGLASTSFARSASSETGTTTTALFAVWSPVSEPSTALLMGLGLVGLGVRRRTT